MVVASMTESRAYVPPRPTSVSSVAGAAGGKLASGGVEDQCRIARRGRPAHSKPQYLSGKPITLLPPARQRRGAGAHRRGIPGVQRRASRRGLPHLHRQDARARARHDDRADGGRRAHARRPRRLHRRADGSRPRRLPDQHRREPVSRSPLRAEFHAAPRLAVRERRRAVRRGDHPHLRRAVPGDGAARDRQLRARLPRPPRRRRADRQLGVSLPARPRPARSPARMRAALRRRGGRDVRRADLHLVAGRQLHRHERRVPRADQRQPA